MGTEPLHTQSPIVGVDVGGTKIAAGVVDVQGRVSGRVIRPTPTGQPEAMLRAVQLAIAETVQVAGVNPAQIAGVGVGIPGEVDAERGVSLLAVNLGWRDVPVKRWLETEVQLPCTVENDVNAATLGEGIYGCGREMANLVYLSLGTGIASRAMIAGQLYRGEHGLAGEIGHMTFVPAGERCLCGGYGCLETVAAGPALARHAQEALQAGQISLLQATSAPLATEHVFAAAEQGDPLALNIVTEAASYLAKAISLLALTFDPQVLVLGGGLALEEGVFIQAIRAETANLATRSPIFQRIFTPELIRRTALKRDSGILGAAALVLSQKEEVRGK